MSGSGEAPEDTKRRWRWFVARRLDRNRWHPYSTDANDDEIEAEMRADGFDPATRQPREGREREPPPDRDAARDTSLAGTRWVRIMAEICTDCVWNAAGEACLADDLPVTDALRARMFAWQDWYDRDCDGEDCPFDRVAFAAEGLAIARAVKAELPGWTVVYHDEGKSGDYRGPRSAFEYEIHVPEAGG